MLLSPEELIEEHMGLVKVLAIKLHEALPNDAAVSLDDLINSGVVGLMQAARTFDSDRKVTFGAFARYRIRGQMIDDLRGLDWASRHVRRQMKRVESIKENLSQTLRRKPNEDELASALQMTLARWRKLALELTIAGPVQLKPVGSGERFARNDAIKEFRSSGCNQPYDEFQNSQLHAILCNALESLPPRDIQALTLYYFDGLTMKEVGLALGVNESRVSQIHKAALEKLRRTLTCKKLTCAAFA